jgi:protein-L-isoaspartate(D-aspartate) O-methyltransferase
MVTNGQLLENNEGMIRHIKGTGYLKSKTVETALRAVPRHNFVPRRLITLAYSDIPLSIGHGQTISQPSTVVAMTEALDVKRGNKILEVGAGSGWQAALLAKLVGSKAKIWTVECIHELSDFARDNLARAGIKNAFVVEGDGSEGLENRAKYDRIIVTAACPGIPPPLIKQLKVGGKMVLPIGGPSLQTMVRITKLKSRLKHEELGGFVFVPLIGKYGFRASGCQSCASCSGCPKMK